MRVTLPKFGFQYIRFHSNQANFNLIKQMHKSVMDKVIKAIRGGGREHTVLAPLHAM